MTAPRIFISYSHRNQSWLDRFVTHLGVSAREGLLEIWEDRRIAVGSEWLSGIEKAINEAQAAIFLISADFLTSEFIRGQEVPRLLERRTQEGLHLFPILVHHCCWEEVPWLAQLQVWPAGGRPLASFKGEQRNAQMATIAREIRKIVSGGLAPRPTPVVPRRADEEVKPGEEFDISKGWSPEEIRSLIHSLSARLKVLEERHAVFPFADIEREVLRVLLKSDQYLRRRDIHEELPSEIRPTPARLGQILEDLYHMGFLVRIHGRSQGNSHSAFYGLSLMGREVCKPLQTEQSFAVEESPPIFEQAVSCLLDPTVSRESRGIVAGLLAQAPREHKTSFLEILQQSTPDAETGALVRSVLESWGNESRRVLIVDDQVGDLGWLVDLIQDRGYEVVLATNEQAARKRFEAVLQGTESYSLVIVDVMVAAKDLMSLDTLDDCFLEESRDTGIRLCRYARVDLGLSALQLPLVCLTAREDAEVLEAMRELGVPLFNRAPLDLSLSIGGFLETQLPPVGKNSK